MESTEVPDPEATEPPFQLWGLAGFVVSGVAFLASGIRSGDWLTIIGSVMWLVGCVFWLIPLLRR
ncbi:MAG: hypothetical protein GY929_03015 [Actinomycetia bacterium]|nr:hypothetical protein [Actinomycetes bacterium]